MADGTEVEILNVIDDHSRFLVASDARAITKAADVVASFHTAAATRGFPASMLTDNGAVFTAVHRGGRCAIELVTEALGIVYLHSSPYHPPDLRQGRALSPDAQVMALKAHEATSIGELQGRLDWFRARYKQVRPHQAIERRSLPRPSRLGPKATPRLPGFVVPTHFRVRKDKVDITWTIMLRHNSRLHHVGLASVARHPGARARRRSGAERRRGADPQVHPRSDTGLPAPRGRS
jgi:hypothetical protein